MCLKDREDCPERPADFNENSIWEVCFMEILRVENLVKTYGEGENQVNAVDDISLSVEKGEFVAIVGASGSGKSTLLTLSAELTAPQAEKSSLTAMILQR